MTSRRPLSQPARRPSVRLALEPRIVFDGAVAAGAAAAEHHEASAPAHEAHAPVMERTAPQAEAARAEPVAATVERAPQTGHRTIGQRDSAERAIVDVPDPTKNEIAFVDASVQSIEAYLPGFKGQVVTIAAGSDGFDQIAAALAGRTGITAIHILGHGGMGSVSLGDGTLDATTISTRYAADLAVIGHALAPHGDILLYACDVAAGAGGQAFITQLAAATGDDVAASTDATGAAALGGNWILEAHTGTIEARALDASGWNGLLVAPVLNLGGTTNELLDGNFDARTQPVLNGDNVQGTTYGAFTSTGALIDVIRVNGTTYVSGPDNANTGNQYITLQGGGTISQSFTITTAQTVTFGASFGIANPLSFLASTESASIVDSNGNTVATALAVLAVTNNPETFTTTTTTTVLAAGTYSFVIQTGANVVVDSASVVPGATYSTLYTALAAPVPVAAPSDSVTTTLGTTLASATVTLTNPQTGDLLSKIGTVSGAITVSAYNTTTHAITLTGTDTIANYTAALRQIGFSNSTATPGTAQRTINVVVNDGLTNSNVAQNVVTVDTAPVANADSFGTPHNVPITLDVRANDTDASANVFAVDKINGTAFNASTPIAVTGGVVTLNASGALVFTPTTGYTGATSFTYNVIDPYGQESAAATVSGTVTDQPPVIDLNSTSASVQDIVNGTFTGGATGWTASGNGTAGSNYYFWDTDSGAGTLTQAGLTNLNRGYGTQGAAAVTLDLGWNNGNPDTAVPATLDITVGGVLYARFTTNPAGGNGATAQVGTFAYFNGASGPVNSVASSNYRNWSFTRLTVNLPANVAATGDLVLSYAAGTGGYDDIAIDNVSVLTRTDPVAGVNYATSYTENSVPTSIASANAEAYDNDDTMLTSATVVITNAQAGDVLTQIALGSTNIAVSQYNESTHTITLTGTDTGANYAAAIRTIGYANTTDNPSTTPRTISVTVNDGLVNSAVATTTVSVIAVNDAPVVNLSNNANLLVDGDFENNVQANVNANNLTGMTYGSYTSTGGNINIIRVDGTGYAPAPDFAYSGSQYLDLDRDGTLSQSFTLSSAQTISFGGVFSNRQADTTNYQVPVTTISILNSGGTVVATGSAVNLTRANGDENWFLSSSTVSLAAGTYTYQIGLGNFAQADALYVRNVSGYSSTYIENAAPTPIAASGNAVTDLDNTTMQSATIVISNVQSLDVLSVIGTLPTGITASAYNAATGTLTLSGTATSANYAAAIAQIGYSSTSENPSATPRVINVTVNDGMSDSNIAVATIAVVPVNDAPVNAGPTTVSSPEDTTLAFTGANALSVSDVDSPNLTVSLNVAHGTLTLGTTTGLTFSSGSGSANTAMTFSGTQAQLNTALASLTYRPSADYNGADTLGFSTSDGSLSTSRPVTLTVTPVADITADSVVTSQNVPISFNAITGTNGASPDTFSDPSRAVTSVTQGAHGTVSFTAAGVLTYTPNTNFNGTDTFTYTVTAGGTTETATETVTINAVNQAPTSTAPTTVSSPEDTTLAFTGGNALTVADVDSPNLTVTLNVAHGTLTLGTTTGLTFTNGTGTANATMTFSGTQAQLNVALASLSYRPGADYNGADTLGFSTSDGALTTTKSVGLTVTPVADITADTVTTNENATIAFNAITGTNGATADTFSDPTRAVTSVTQGAHGTVAYNANGTLTYTPNTNYYGSDTFTYTVTAGGTTETATETVNIAFVNQTPTSTAPTAVTSNEDTTLAFTGGNALSVADVDSPNLTVSLNVAHGTLTLGTTTGLTFSIGTGSANASMTFSGTQAQVNNALASLSYRPSLDYNGSDTLNFTTSDGTTNAAKTVALTVTPVADITADTVTTNENTAIAFNAITGTNGATADTFSDPSRAVTSVTQGAHGTVAYNANGTLTYTPNTNYYGTDTFTYTVTAGGTTETATETVNIAFVNQAPTSTAPVAVTSNEDTTLAFIGGNALSVADVDSTNLTVSLNVAHGTLTLGTITGLTFTTGTGTANASMTFTGTQPQINSALASLSYRPSADYNGADTLSFTTSDGTLNAAKTVALTVNPVADITADSVTTGENAAISFNAITGTNGATADTFSDPSRAVTAVTQGAHGSVAFNANGTLTYTPNTNYFGTDTFTYTVTAGGTTETATETVTVNFINQAPTSTAPSNVSSPEDTTLAFTGTNRLTVLDFDSTNLTVTLNVAHGTLTLGTTTGLTFTTGNGTANAAMTFSGTQAQLNNALSSLSYRPSADYNGSDTLNFTTTDGSLNAAKAIALTVTPVADIRADTVTTNENAVIAFNAITGTNGATADTFSDPSRAVTSVTQGAHGTVAYNADGTLTYTPNTNYSGADTFTYTVTSGGTTETATETVNVTFVNQAPTSTAPTTVTSNEDTTLAFTGGNVLSVADVDSTSLTVTLNVTRGTLTLGTITGLTFTTGTGTANAAMTFSGTQSQLNAALASLTFRPNADFNGNATLNFTTSDGALNTAKTVALTIAPVADIRADTVTTNENTVIAFNAITGTNGATADTFSDPARAVTSVTQGAHGTVAYNADGTLTYTPNANYSGTDTFNYTVTSGGTTETATETVNVTFVNQAPTTTAPTTVTSNEDTTVAFTGGNALSVADVDSPTLTVSLNVAHGTLTLGTITGLTFTTGNGTANAAMTFSGTQAQLNAALASLTFRPNADFNGSDTLGFTTSDGSLNSAKSIALTITPVADITADNVSTNQNVAIAFNAITGTNGATADTFSDPSRAVTSVTQGAHGSVTFNANGTLTYTPNTNYNGNDTFTYTVTSGGTTETATETVTVGAVNQAPTSAAPTSASIAEDTTFNFTGGNALSVADVDSPNLIVSLNVAHGSLTLGTITGLTFTTGNGTANPAMTFSGTQAQLNAALASLSFRPNADYNGSDALAFSTSDGSLTATKTVALTVTPVADITADTVTTNENAAIVFNAITGTNGAAADTFSDPARAITSVTQGANGAVSSNANGALTYTPNANFSGTDTFTYTVTSGGTTETATETVNVTFVNQAPTSTAPTAANATEDTSRGFRGANALSVSDVDSPNLTVTLNVAHGTLTLGTTTGLTFTTGNGTANAVMTFSGTQAQLNNALASLNYLPSADYNGSDTLNFTTSDGSLTSVKAIALTVAPVADITADTVTTNENAAIVFNAITGTNGATADTFSDPSRAITSVTQGANGSVTFNANGTLTYTPNTNFSGTDTFTYTVTSGGTTETATETVNVIFVNQTPTSTAPTTVTSNEDTTIAFTGGNALTVADVDSPNLTVSLNVAHGTLTLGTITGLTFTTGSGTANTAMTFSGTQAQLNAALASLTFRPNADYNGSDMLVFGTTDGSSTSSKSVALTIAPVADIRADTVTTNENTVIAFNAITGTNGATADTFSDPARAVTSVTQGAHGTVAYNADGTLTYTPNANYSGTDTFNYTVTSGGTTETATETVNVTFVNQAPTTTAPTTVTSNEDTTVAFTGGNALSVADVDSPTLTVSLNVAHGTLTLGTITGLTFTTGNGTANTAMTFSGTQAQLNAALASLTFRPNADFNGSDTLNFSAGDGSFNTAKAISLTIAPVADITADTVTTNENAAIVFNAITGTNGATADTFSDPSRAITSVTQGAHGSVIYNANGTLTYTPNANSSGADTFTYTVTSGGTTETATETVNVTFVNQAPTSTAPTTVTSNEDTTIAFSGGNALAVADVDSPTLTVSLNVAHGTLTLGTTTGLAFTTGTGTANAAMTFSGTQAQINGALASLTFRPNADFNGADTLAFTTSDGSLTSTKSINLTIVPVADIRADSVTTNENTAIVFNAITGTNGATADTFSDPARAVTSVTQGAHGTVAYNADGTLTYTPNANYYGSDAFDYTVTAGGNTETASETVNVAFVNQAPTSNAPAAITSAEDTTVNFNGPNAFNVGDVDNPTLTVSLTVTHGTLTLATTTGLTFTTGNGAAATAMTFTGTQAQLNTALASLSFRPDADFNGSAALGFSTSDGSLTTTKTVALTITPVADIRADSVSTNENTVISFNAITGTNGATADTFSDPNRAVTSVTQGQHGTVAFTAAGVLTYTPNANFFGSDSYSYTVTAGGSTETAAVSMTVVHVNQAPVAVNDSFTVAEDAIATIDVRANDVDVDNDPLTVTKVNGQAITAGGASVAVTGGTITLGSSGSLIFTPTPYFRGSTSFSYTVADPSGATSSATVNGTITPVNHAPTAVNDTNTIDEDHGTSGNALANDSDADGDTLAVSAVNGNAASVGVAVAGSNGGLFTIQANGSYAFATNGQFEDLGAGQSRTTTVAYTAADGQGGTANATITITVTGVNDAPVANADTFDTTDTSGVPRGLPLTNNVLTNDTDAEHDTLTVSAVNGSAAAVGVPAFGSYGTLTLNANGTFSYSVDQTNLTVLTLLRGQSVTDQFTYTASDGHGGTASTTLAIRVQGTNDGLMAGNDSNAMTQGQVSATGNVITGSRTDGSGVTTTVPSAADTDPGFTLNVNTIRLPGEATGTAVTGATPGSRTGQYGTLTIDAGGNYTYALNNGSATVQALVPGQPVTDSFVYSVTDSSGRTTEATILVSINGRNDAPIAQNDTFTTAEGTQVAIDVRANDSDPDHDPIRVTAVNGTALTAGGAGVTVTGGTVTLNTTGDLVFTPGTYYRGSPSFTYTIEDPSGATGTATVNGTVTPVNHAPTAVADTFTTAQNAATTIDVRANDSDVDGDAITVTQVNGNAITAGGAGVLVNGGTVTLTAAGSLVFTPTNNFSGSSTFSYTISDPSGASASSTVNGNVSHVNQPPMAVADQFTSAQNTTAVINVRANDSDPDGDAIAVTQVNGTAITAGGAAVAVTGGTVVLDTAGNLEFTPTGNFRGNTSFTYTVSDPFGATGSATVGGTITGVNHAPIAVPDSFTVTQGATATIDARANDTDADGDPLTITQVNGTAVTAGGAAVAVTGGTVALDLSGRLVFTPTAGYAGPTSFGYTVSDPSGATSSATVSGTVTVPANHAPVAVNDAFTISANTSAVFDATANDADVDGDALTVTQVNGTAVTIGGHAVAVTGGTVTLDGSGRIVFTPTAGFAGTTSFTYTERDPSGATSTATVNGTVTRGLHEPTAVPDTVSIPENAGPTVIDVRGNDVDVDGNPLTITQINGVAITAGGPAVTVAGGTVALDATGNLLFTPTANVNGPAGFSYTISDPAGLRSTALVNLTVTPAARAPMAVADTFTVAENAGAVLVNVRGNDVDPAGDPLTITRIDGTAIQAGGSAVAVTGGSVSLDANGNLFFTPTPNLNGPASFSYTVGDPAGSSSTARVAVGVTPGAHAPVAVPDSFTIAENAAATVLPVRANDTDPDGAPLTITRINGQSITAGGPGIAVPGGTVNLDVAGKLLFTPTANLNGPVTFSYTISDPAGSLSTAVVSLNVVPLDIGPVARPDTATGTGPVTVAVLANDTDATGGIVTSSVQLGGTARPGDPLVIAGQGTFTIDPASGAITFTPVAGFVGTATATYSVADSNGLRSTPAPLSFSVAAAPLAPVARPDSFTVAENSTTTINVLANDTAGTAGPLTVTQVNGQAVTVNGPPVVTAAGSFTLDANGNLHFTPTPNYSGPVSFTYTARDPSGATVTGSASGTVTPAAGTPVAAPDVAYGEPGAPVTIDVLSNDSAVPGDPIRVTAVNGQPIAVGGAGVAIAGGVITLDADGNLRFVPNAGSATLLATTFSYTVTSRSGAQSSASVTLNLNGVTNPPVGRGVGAVGVVPGSASTASSAPSVVLQSVDAIRVESGLDGVGGSFVIDVATGGFIAAGLDGSLVSNGPGIGLIPRDANLSRDYVNAHADSLYVQHAVRYEDLATTDALFVQRAVRQSQAEALLLELRASEFDNAVGGTTLVDPFVVGATGLPAAHEATRDHDDHQHHHTKKSHHHAHRHAAHARHEPVARTTDVREAQSGFTAQLKQKARGLRPHTGVRGRPPAPADAVPPSVDSPSKS